MQIEIKLNLTSCKEWDDSIFESNQHSIFLSEKFLNYHPEGRFDNFNIFVFVEQKLFLIIPAIQKNNMIISHSGSTYGGIIQLSKLNRNQYSTVKTELINFLRSKKIKFMQLRLAPRIFTENTEYDFIDSIDNFEFLYEEEETYVELIDKDIANLDKTGFRRNHIRDIKKVILIEDKLEFRRSNSEADLKDYYELLKKNLQRHNVTPTHSITELKWLIENLKNHIWIELLTYENKIVSGLVCFKMNTNVLHYFYGSTDYEFKNKGILKYAYWQSMINAKKNNFQYVNFGVDSKFGEVHNQSLRMFKEGFSGKHTHRKTVKFSC